MAAPKSIIICAWLKAPLTAPAYGVADFGNTPSPNFAASMGTFG